MIANTNINVDDNMLHNSQFHTLSDFQDCLHWDNRYITSLAFHFLAVPCPNNNISDEKNLERYIEAPSTFFVQLMRLSLCLTFIIIIFALYNSIEVLGRTVFSIASCSLHWVLFYLLILCKSLVLIVMVPVLTRMMMTKDHKLNLVTQYDDLNLSGFLVVTLFQYAATITLFCSLEHEFKFRTAEYASVEAPLSRRCGSLMKLKLYITWPRGIILCIATVSLLLLIAIEIVLAIDKTDKDNVTGCLDNGAVCYDNVTGCVPASLVWVWLSSVIIIRLGVIIIGVGLLLIRHETLRLTIPAKIYLVIGLALSLMEDIPNSVLTLSNYTYKPSDTDQAAHCLDVITSFDICQLLGGLSLIAFLLFIRSQYLRVEQESKLTVVWDMQRLLQVNGRKDYRTH